MFTTFPLPRPQFCRSLKEQKGFKSLGFVGYCFGGTVSVFLARADSPVDACVCFHPGGPNVAEWEKIAKPFCLVCPEGEFADRGRSCSARRIAHTASLRHLAEDFTLDSKKPAVLPLLEKLPVPTCVWDDNPGTTHGFGCRPNLQKPQIREAFERGLARTKDWFEEHL